MEIVADLHLHSKYSRAVSSRMVIPQMAAWAKKKGIQLLGTADWTHPLWFKELQLNLEETGAGIYRCRGTNGPFFLLTTEIASIYSQNNRLHKIHNLVFAPNLTTAAKVNAELTRRGGNLMADGRPILGLTSRDLTELLLSIDPEILVIPAHIWTPWFSLFGANSGFDSLQECFSELSDRIYAIETGLSSDPGMNWRIKELDNRTILSFSDAHSPEKLGREATVFKIENDKAKGKNFNYAEIKKAIVEEKIAYTIEFYPEEGKYHYTGHRQCQVRQTPQETKKLGTICPVCGKKLTVGVMHRVEQLASPAGGGANGGAGTNRPPYKMLVPLMEILAESLASGVGSQAVFLEYQKLVSYFGSEFVVLLEAKAEEIAKISGEKVADGVTRVRTGQLQIEPGYDGVFGKVKIWPASVSSRMDQGNRQMNLF